MSDFKLQPEGTISVLYPISEAAIQWAADNINQDAQKWGKNGIVIDHRYVQDIVHGFTQAGLTVEVM